MGGVVDLLQLADADVRVELGGVQVRVPNPGFKSGVAFSVQVQWGFFGVAGGATKSIERFYSPEPEPWLAGGYAAARWYGVDEVIDVTGPTLRAEMGISEGGYDEPHLIVEWPDARVPHAVVMAVIHSIVAAIWELRIGRTAGWPVMVPDSAEQCATGTRVVIAARTWPRSTTEACEALDVFHAVAASSANQ